MLTEIFGYPLIQGEAKETAGGMLIAIAEKDADDLLSELDKRKVKHFEVGYSNKRDGNVNVLKNVKVIEV